MVWQGRDFHGFSRVQSPQLPSDGTTSVSSITPSSVRESLTSIRISLGLLLCINLINYIDRYIIAGVLPLVEKELLGPEVQDPKFWMGLLSPAFLVTYMVAAPFFGYLGDRTRRWTVVGCGVLFWTVATGMTGLATAYWFLLLMRILVGLGEAAWGPIAPTIISDMYPVSKRGWVLSWFYIAIPVGSALGFMIGGKMAELFSWHWAFFVVVPPGILFGILALFRPEPRRGDSDLPVLASEQSGTPAPVQPKVKLSWSLLRLLVKNRSFLFNTTGMTAMTFAIGGMSFWMPTYIFGRMGGQIGSESAAEGASGTDLLAHINFIFGAITVVAGIAGTLIGGAVSDRLRTKVRGAYFAFSGVSMLVAFPFFILTLMLPFPWAWVCMGIALFLIFLSTGPTNAIIANVIPASVRSTAFALNIFIIHALGDAISPPIMGFIADRSSMNIAFGVVGVTILLGGILWILGARFLDADTKTATAGVMPGSVINQE